VVFKSCRAGGKLFQSGAQRREQRSARTASIVKLSLILRHALKESQVTKSKIPEIAEKFGPRVGQIPVD
jgi:hypothetical protein